MSSKTKKHDWGLVAAGVLLVVCAVFFFLWPGITLVTITSIAGAAFLVAGVFDIVNYVRFHKTMHLSGWSILYGICDIVLGVMLLMQPLLFAAVIPWMCGAFFIAFGIVEIVNSGRAKKLGLSMGWLVFSGIVSVLCGLMFFFSPASLSIFLSVFLMMRGFSLIFYGWSVDKAMPKNG